jgi:ATP-dependent DNA helicase 2 subunit 1
MNRGDKSFDPSLFYQHIISTDEDDFVGLVHVDASAKFEELRARVRRKEFKKRSLGRIPLSLRPGLTMSVQLYNLLHEAKKSSYISLDGRSNQRVKTQTKYVCRATGSWLMPNQMASYYEYGGQKVQFSGEELKSVKAACEKGIQLMGFKPKSALKEYHFCRSSAFLYPDDSTIKGSSTLFAALLDRTLQKEKIAIARFVPRDNAMPVFVALVPQEEEFDEDGSQFIPPGFHVIYLPFAGDIRSLELPKTTPANEEQVEAAKAFVKKIRIRFDSRSFENPILQTHYAALQALALDREKVEKVPDYVTPDTEGMRKFSPLVQHFRDSVFGPESEEERDARMAMASVGVKKRGRAAGDDNEDKKKVQKVTELDLEDYKDEAKVNKLTIPSLKVFMKVRRRRACQSLCSPPL